MTAKKRSTAKSKAKTSPDGKPGEVRDFDPHRISDSVIEYVEVTMTFPDGTRESVMVPKFPDDTVDVVNERAAEYARAFRRVADAWVGNLTPEAVSRLTEHLIMTSAHFVVRNLVSITRDRFGDEALASMFEAKSDDEIETAIRRAVDKQAAFLSSRLEIAGAEKIIDGLERDIFAGILLDFEREQGDALTDLSDAEYNRLLNEAQAKYRPEHAPSLYFNAAQDIARARLEGLKAGGATLDQIVELLNPTPDTVLNLGTHPIGREMQRGLIRPTLDPTDQIVRIKEGGKNFELKVRTGVSLEALAGKRASFERQEDVLENIQRSLLEVKKHGAALLKLHLDLTSRAYEVGGELPIFDYNFADALDRLGYSRHEKRRGYDAGTMQGLRERIITLQSHQVAAWHTKRGAKETLTKTPYWIVEAYHYSKQEMLDFAEVDLVPNLLRQQNATAYTGVIIRPGLWWATTQMNHYRIEVPRALLQLPTDGNGNERERMALLIATFLAVHVRRNQRKNAGKSIPIRAGVLLEESGITTRSAFLEQHGTVAGRQRDYLEDTDGTGALQILRDLRAFDLTIRDESDYFATGRGWRDRFWDAMLEVEVPDLGIAALRKA